MPLTRVGRVSRGALGVRWDAEFHANPYDDFLSRMFNAWPEWIPLRHAASALTSGHTPLGHDLEEGDADFLTVECLDPLSIDFSKAKRVTEQQAQGELGRVRLRPGDVLVSIKRRIANACPVPALQRTTAVNQDIAVVRLLDGFLPGFVAAALSSRVGKFQANKQQTEQINPYLSVGSLGQLLLPVVPLKAQRPIEALVVDRLGQLRRSIDLLHKAELAFAEVAGLNDVSLRDPLVFTRQLSSLKDSGRFDAQFFSPRLRDAFAILSRRGQRVGDICEARRDRFQPSNEPFRYVEISDVRANGRVSSSSVDGGDAPSRATWVVQSGDVITSLVRPIRRLSGVIDARTSGAVCSSGLAVLKATRIPPEVLMVFLRHPLVAGIMDLKASASMYPAITAADVLALPFPNLSDSAIASIRQFVLKSWSAAEDSESLADAAVAAVEKIVFRGEKV